MKNIFAFSVNRRGRRLIALLKDLDSVLTDVLSVAESSTTTGSSPLNAEGSQVKTHYVYINMVTL